VLPNALLCPTPQVYRLTVDTDIYLLRKVQDWFEQFRQILPYGIWMQCNLVLVEAFSNVVDHAHRDLPPTTPIDIEVRVSQEQVELRVWDYGKPFDLQRELKNCLERHSSYDTVDDIPTGGRGLIIAHNIADTLLYERQPDQRNCFIFVKRLAGKAPEPTPKATGGAVG
jgi:serine/threonine-protein kinase RsbW